MSLTFASTRRPRFRRCDPPPIRLTADDLAILRHVGEHRFLRSSHLAQLLGRSQEKVGKRLAALYHNGWLDRPRQQLDYHATAGSSRLVYALGNRGAAQYAAITAIDPALVDWTDKNRDVHRPYIEHALLVADLMVALECATRDHATVRLLSAKDILADQRRAGFHPRASWTMTATVPGEHTEIAVTPDKVFGLEYRDTGHRNYFFVEADRATMPITRASLTQSSIRKKLLTYYHGHQAKQHTRLWGLPGFRVLTITRSEERIASMIEVVTRITAGKRSNMFLFTHSSPFSASVILSDSWLSTNKQSAQLLPH